MAGNDSFTKILLHMDGTDGTTTFTDSNIGGSAHTWTANGNAQIDTAIAKFGSAAGLFDGTGDYIDTTDHADFSLGSGDFTIDFWFNRAGGDGTGRLIAGQSDSAGSVASTSFTARLHTTNVVLCQVSDGAALTSVTGTTTFTATGWHHVAFVRTGNTLRMFVDGVQEGGDVAFSATVNNSTNKFAVGRLGELTTNTWNGSIDEFRLSIGTARWTANFTPPTSAYGVELGIGAGAYIVSGQNIGLAYGHKVPVGAGSYALSGQAVSLVYGHPLAIGVGGYVLTGQDVALRAIRFLTPVVAGSYVLSGQAVGLAYGHKVPVGAGAYTYTGQAVALRVDWKVLANVGAYTLTGQIVAITATRKFYPDAGAYSYTGKDVNLVVDLDLSLGIYIRLRGRQQTSVELDGRFIDTQRLSQH